MMSTCLQLMAAEDWPHARAYLVQCLKALHQVAVDHGKWETADLMLPLGEGQDLVHFAGSEREMQAVHGYKKAMTELKKGQGQAGQADDSEESDEEEKKLKVQEKAARAKRKAAKKK